MTTKRINVAIDEQLYNYMLGMAEKELRSPANFLRLLVENTLRNIAAQQANQQQS